MYTIMLFLVMGGALIQAVPLISNKDKPVIDIEKPSTTNKDIIDLSSYGSALFGKPDRELTAERVSKFNAETDNVNPEELGSYLEGDILIPQITVKNSLVTHTSRWPNGIVPFVIRGSFNELELEAILNAMEEYHLFTCIRFVPHSYEKDHITITNDWSGCWSSVGRVGGQQIVNLQTHGCFRKPATVHHELMHALGFLHEQSRMERDDYVSIRYDNIRPHAISNFRKVNQTEAFGVPYDYDSVMHYSARAFSQNGEPTIVAKQAISSIRMGQRFGFSEWDIEKLNRMYDCSVQSVSKPIDNPTPSTISSSEKPDVDSLLKVLVSQWGQKDGQSELRTS